MSLHLLNSFLPVAIGEWHFPYTTCSFKGCSSICLTQFTECTITINIIFQPSKVFFPPFLVLSVAASTCSTILELFLWMFTIRCTDAGFLLGGMSLSSSLLLSLLLGAIDVDGVLKLKKYIYNKLYDLTSILKPGKSWLNLTITMKQSRLTLSCYNT